MFEDPILQKIMILHGHWVTADSINYHLRRSVNAEPEANNADVQQMYLSIFGVSEFRALSVWYSLLYVVVEGYQSLNISDVTIDSLLSQTEYVSDLRRFRNAVFHYQSDPLSDKLLDFLQKADSEKWIRELNSAFKRYFEKTIPFDDILSKIKM